MNQVVDEVCEKYFTDPDPDQYGGGWPDAQTEALLEGAFSTSVGFGDPRRFATFVLRLKKVLRVVHRVALSEYALESAATAALPTHPQVAWWLVTMVGPCIERGARQRMLEEALESFNGPIGLHLSQWQFAYQVLLDEPAPRFNHEYWWRYLEVEVRDEVWNESFRQVAEQFGVTVTELFMVVKPCYDNDDWPAVLTTLMVYGQLEPEELLAIFGQFSEEEKSLLEDWLYTRFFLSLEDLTEEAATQLNEADADLLAELKELFEHSLPSSDVLCLLRALPVPLPASLQLYNEINRRLHYRPDPMIDEEGEILPEMVEKFGRWLGLTEPSEDLPE